MISVGDTVQDQAASNGANVAFMKVAWSLHDMPDVPKVPSWSWFAEWDAASERSVEC